MIETIIISLGGSIIVPAEINVNFLKKFRQLILKQKNKRFVIVCGGGGTNRKYNEAAQKITKPIARDLDWLGIKATRLNAELVRVMFGDKAYFEVVKNPEQKIKTTKKIIIGAGWEPGWSTDLDTVLLAKNFKAQVLINLSNIDCVYAKDPREFKNVQKFKSLTWPEYRRLINSKWNPRLSTPFDPVASRLAQKHQLRVIIARGTDFKNLVKILTNKNFRGTIIG